ncbi:unnamed protein product, partial [Brenthis ino]
MKIPETSANVGAYYGNEENGQWQPNGVIIDSGVGGGVVGSGDAGHRPVYPVHVPRGHIPGPYVMAGAYYPPGAYPAPQDDFADYMWMENEEEFDKQVMQQLEEEALMEQCIEAMLEDEQREQRLRPVSNGHNHYPTTSNGQGSLSLEEAVSRSTLNPLAAEFVPNRARQATEEPQETTESKTEVESSKETSEQTDQQSKLDSKEDVKAEEPPQPTDPPEVSAADVQPIEDKKQKEVKKDTKKPEVKKGVKAEVKKTKPIPVKETKTQKKKEEKVKKEECKEEPSGDVKQTSPAPEETSQSGIKPINYAAAAKAMKPKKPMSPTNQLEPPTEKPKAEKLKAEKVEKKMVKDKPKVDKPNVQRKNSAK